MPRRTSLSAGMILIAVVMPAQAVGADADILARRFLDHMSAIGPVAGTFEVVSTQDPQWLEARKKGIRDRMAAQKKGVDFGPDMPRLRCEWAWDGNRESLKTLDSSNVWRDFFNTPEASLQGMQPKNYNLDRPKRFTIDRPAIFYVFAAFKPWSKVFEKARLSVEAAPTSAPPGSAVLLARSPQEEIRLLIDEASGTLHQCEIQAGGKPYSRLVVERLERGPQNRVYPSKAHLTIFDPKSGRSSQEKTMTAERIVFPTGRPETDAVFAMTLPAGSVIHDRPLNRQITLNRPTPVQAVIEGQVPPDPVEVPRPAGPMSPPVAPSRWPAWAAWTAVVLLVIVGVYAAVKGVRHRQSLGGPR
jgi:hypothetical protein